MMDKRQHLMPKIAAVFCFWLCCHMGFSQVKEVKAKDSTSSVYQEIEQFSKNSKLTKFVHKLVFKSVDAVINQRSSEVKEKGCNCADYQNKIIRKIQITTLDPFGYSETDSLKSPKNWVEKSGNVAHVKSKQFNIRNLLLIKPHDTFDSIAMMETERLIRNQRYVRSVSIVAQATHNSQDSVDVLIRVLDSWSLIPTGSVSTSRLNVKTTERNILGTGHEMTYERNALLNENRNANSIRYVVPNFKNTFIRTLVEYNEDVMKNYNKGINIERTFFSPLTKWAGGASIYQHLIQDSLRNSQQEFVKQTRKYNNFDFWGGRAFQLYKGNEAVERATSLVLKARYFNQEYLNRPLASLDSLNFYSNERFVLTSIGITSRRFYQEKFIFNYDIVEDVPIGKTYQILTGYQRKNQSGRLYLGAEVGYANYFSWGYLSANFEYGTFLRNRAAEQTAYIFELNYFTNLLKIGGWRIRQFLKPQLTFGKNRLPFFADQITLNQIDNGITGFNSISLFGTQKFLMTFQTQSYSPWNFAGFRLNPFFSYTVGMIGNEQNKFKSSRPYSKFSLGFLINNDYLVFGNLQVSFSYFPTIPGIGDNIFNSNSFNTEDFGFQDFEIGKPNTAAYK